MLQWLRSDGEKRLDNHGIAMMGFLGIMESIRHAWSKPPQVIAFRTAQEFCLGIMRYAGAWPRLEQSIRVWWSDERTQHYRAAQASSLSIIAPDASEALC